MTRTFLVSGAGSGIGRAVAVDLAKELPDASVVLFGRREAALEETRKLMARPDRHQVVSVGQDDHAALKKAFAKLDLPGRNVVGVIANAGVGGSNQYGDRDRWHEVINTNLTGTYYFVSESLPALMAAKDKPRNIVIISSILARLGVPGYTAYCASKAGLLGMMRSMAVQQAKNQIYVNAVLPGWVDTDMARQGIKLIADHNRESYEKALAEQMALVPTQKMSTPAEIAGLITYLVSGKQASFTGQCFDMNNGALMP